MPPFLASWQQLDRSSIRRLRKESTHCLAWSPDSRSLRSLDQVKTPQTAAIQCVDGVNVSQAEKLNTFRHRLFSERTSLNDSVRFNEDHIRNS
jgi:hypothetical protein